MATFRKSLFQSLFPHFIIPAIHSRDSQIQAQIDVLNQDYNGTGLSFQLQNITRVLNPAWFNNVAPNTNEQTAMKRALRQGDVKTLNIYTVGFNNSSAQNITGYTTQPADYAANPMNDGVVVVYSTLPGGSQAPFNLGRSLTHEVGHWVGLLHPFQGGCDGPNDYVDDTPAEASPAYGCPIGRDTCPSPGLDRELNFESSSHISLLVSFFRSRSKLHGLFRRLVHEQLYSWTDRASQIPDLDLPRNQSVIRSNRASSNVQRRLSGLFLLV